MKVHIYYGGRGLIEDPTIYVINKITEVLSELRVEVKRFNLFEDRNGIVALPKTIKEADGVILATTVEWLGIGGLMQQFLDSCWLYSDREKISTQYMLPIAMATTYGERDAHLTLIKAWEILGGIACDGLCAYVEDHVSFETNADYAKIIEKKAEFFYRSISQKVKSLPSSNSAVTQNISRATPLDLTPQESEQLSMYVSDDTYVKKQKEDIKELTDMFKELLWGTEEADYEFVTEIKRIFKPNLDYEDTYVVNFSDKDKTLVIEVNGDELKSYYGEYDSPDMTITTKTEEFEKILAGDSTIERAFMSGTVTIKGNLELIKHFDKSFSSK